MKKPGRTLAIGDIHGHSKALRALINKLNVGSADTVITLGDVIDRGPDSCGVVQTLLRLSVETNLVSLRGNHEEMLTRAANERSAIAPWLGWGGEETMASYEASSFESIPPLHWDYFDGLLAYYETQSEIFVHAAVAHNRALSEQSDEILFWQFLDPNRPPPPHKSGKRTICGHTPQQSGRPLNLGHVVCIDTNITDGGWLTALDVASNCYWQADASGNLRKGQLELPG